MPSSFIAHSSLTKNHPNFLEFKFTPTETVPVASQTAPKTEMGFTIEISSEIVGNNAGMNDNSKVKAGSEIPFDITPSSAAAKMNVLYGSWDENYDTFAVANRFVVSLHEGFTSGT